MSHVDIFYRNWFLEEIVIVIEKFTERYQIIVTYPEYFLSEQPIHSFNVLISSQITGYVEEFTDTAKQIILPDERKFQLKGEHFTYTAMRRYITAKIDLYPQLGGVHPGHDMLTSTFDSAANTTIALSDFFAAGSDYLERLSMLAEEALFEKYPELSFAFNDLTYRKGFAPKEENFKFWALTDSGFIIFFPVYQVAPYAAGPLNIEIPYVYIMDIIA